MRLWIRPVIAAAVVLVGLWFAWGWLFPDDEVMIRALLHRIEENLGATSQDGATSRIARVASLRPELDPQITVNAGPPFSQLSGRDAVLGTAARLTNSLPDLALHFVDVQISLAPDHASASAYMTAEVTAHDARGEQSFEAWELDVGFRKLDSAWVISNVSLVRTLEPVIPR